MLRGTHGQTQIGIKTRRKYTRYWKMKTKPEDTLEYVIKGEYDYLAIKNTFYSWKSYLKPGYSINYIDIILLFQI